MRRALEEVKKGISSAVELLPKNVMRRVYADFIALLKNEILLPEDIARDASARQRFVEVCQRTGALTPWLAPISARPDSEALKRLVVNVLLNVYRTYCSVLRRHGRIDFDDQKLLPYLALAKDERLAAAVMAPYSSIVVDEFQDINRLDFELINLLSRQKKLAVVGDDDQAIYGFRGCSPDYIVDFDKRISPRTVEDHVLQINYRCPRNIVAMSTALIRHNERRIDKNAIAHSNTDADVQVWHCANCASEAQVVARTIRRVVEDNASKGLSYADVAVLFRINSQSLPLQLALILEEIPYHCRKEDNIVLADTMEKILGLLELHLKMRSRGEEVSRRASRLLSEAYFRYPRDFDISRLHNAAIRHGGYVHAARVLAREDGKFTPSFATAVEALALELSPGKLLERIGSDFKSLGGLIGSLEDAVTNGLPLGELVDIARRFKGSTEEFHVMLSNLAEKARGGLFTEREGDGVNLLTYFRAKGRQWHTVILPGVNQKVIPHGRAPIEDERRLFYVAATRATSNLFLSYVRSAVRVAVEPSQFLKEMGAGAGQERRAAVFT